MSYDTIERHIMNPFHHFFGPHRGHHHGRRGDRPHGHSHADRHCMRRGDHGGAGRGHGDRSGREQGFDGFERGRKFGSAELQLLILALLAERARHGYELIKEIEQRSGGWYVPSPGMVYPALSYLEDAGYASVEPDGAKKLYTISVAGLAWLDEHRAEVEALWAQLARFAERLGQAREEARFARDVGEGRAELHAAMHELRDALRAQQGTGADAIARVVAIVRRAAAQVRGEG
jgi:DNA-binding PadR family transcriptional regulator